MRRNFVPAMIMAVSFLSCGPFAAVNANPGGEAQRPTSESLVVIQELVSQSSLMMMMIDNRSNGQENVTAGNESYTSAAATAEVTFGQETFSVPMPIANTMPNLETKDGTQDLTILEYGTGGIPYTTKGSYASNSDFVF